MSGFRDLLEHRRLKAGTYLGEFATPGIARMMRSAGCDFAFVDMEHSGFSFETVKALLRHLHDSGIGTLLRPPSKAPHHIARSLDVGAQALIPPMLGSAEETRELISLMKYPPVGKRGAAFGIAHDDYEARPVPEATALANRKTCFVGLIETADGINNIDEITAVDGLDCLWIGHLDLSLSLGIPGEFDNPIFVDAVATVMAAAKRNGKSVGRLAGSGEQARALFAEGCDFLCYMGDIWLFQSALASGVSGLREAIGDKTAGET